jgi:DNA-binding protein H-NS
MEKSSYAEFIEQCKTLLGAAEAHPDLAQVGPLRLALKQQVEAIEAVKLRQTEAKAERQVQTQTLRDRIAEAQETAQRLRVWVKANLGPKNERLSQFGMTPQRKRSRASKAPELPPPTANPAAAAPAAPAGPQGPAPNTGN